MDEQQEPKKKKLHDKIKTLIGATTRLNKLGMNCVNLNASRPIPNHPDYVERGAGIGERWECRDTGYTYFYATHSERINPPKKDKSYVCNPTTNRWMQITHKCCGTTENILDVDCSN